MLPTLNLILNASGWGWSNLWAHLKKAFWNLKFVGGQRLNPGCMCVCVCVWRPKPKPTNSPFIAIPLLLFLPRLFPFTQKKKKKEKEKKKKKKVWVPASNCSQVCVWSLQSFKHSKHNRKYFQVTEVTLGLRGRFRDTGCWEDDKRVKKYKCLALPGNCNRWGFKHFH